MAFFKLNNENFDADTPIPNVFIDNYLPKANATFGIIYIYGLRQCFKNDVNVSNAQIAEALDILESDVVKAWKYWKEQGLVKLINENTPESMTIEFLKIAKEDKNKKIITTKPLKAFESRPHYATEELNIYMDSSEEARNIFSLGHKYLGKLLSYNDMSVLFSFYDWLGFPVDLIELVLSYCASNNHRNMRYIEKVAIEWAERGIDTAEKANEYITVFNKYYREIMKGMGINKRDPVPVEVEFMNKWLYVFHLPLEVVKEACKKTILNTGQANFPYADSILSNWHENNVGSLDDVKKLEEDFGKAKVSKEQAKTTAPSPASRAKSKFVNYEQREWDFEELEKLENDLLEKEILERELKG